jgi:glycosyltransferase involved in cell wall biosynthesis
MAGLRVLYVLHNHPELHPGGAEAYALEVYEAMRDSRAVEPILLARIGSNVARTRTAHPGTPISSVNGDPNQYFVFTETEHFDFFHMTSRDKSLYSRHLTDFLLAHRPDIVHLQHTQFIGMDLITQIHRVLPHVPIVYTLHEFLPICHRDGQMVRTFNDELCTRSSPRRCHECFPGISPQDFFLRQRFIQGHLDSVDLFLAPSMQLLERYVDWGIPAEKIRFEEYGRHVAAEPAPVRDEREAHRRFGFFGQLSPFKGSEVLLRAMAKLARERVRAHLWMYGANLDLQTEEFQAELKELLVEVEDIITFGGSYEHSELPKLIANVGWVIVPSIWWENSPLVIQEAFMHARPVICSDIGGMAEKVTDGVDGLHFRVGDPMSLARTLERAANSHDLWDDLRRGIPDVYDIGAHAKSLIATYEELVHGSAKRDRRPAGSGARR